MSTKQTIESDFGGNQIYFRRNQLEVAEPEADAKEKTDNLAVLTEKDKSPSFERRSRSASSQRWLKLRTTVQLTAAMSNSVQTKRTTLKREDSFIARFSTRQIPESQVSFLNYDLPTEYYEK